MQPSSTDRPRGPSVAGSFLGGKKLPEMIVARSRRPGKDIWTIVRFSYNSEISQCDIRLLVSRANVP